MTIALWTLFKMHAFKCFRHLKFLQSSDQAVLLLLLSDIHIVLALYLEKLNECTLFIITKIEGKLVDSQRDHRLHKDTIIQFDVMSEVLFCSDIFCRYTLCANSKTLLENNILFSQYVVWSWRIFFNTTLNTEWYSYVWWPLTCLLPAVPSINMKR